MGLHRVVRLMGRFVHFRSEFARFQLDILVYARQIVSIEIAMFRFVSPVLKRIFNCLRSWVKSDAV